jgi:hypothetical protein
MTAFVLVVTADVLLRSGRQRQVFRRLDKSILVPTAEHEQSGVLAHRERIGMARVRPAPERVREIVVARRAER